MDYRESIISAHHNYLVNGLLTPGFVLGEPASHDGFWFIADMLTPNEKAPRISGRFFDSGGRFLLLMRCNEIVENPAGCTYHAQSEGFRIVHASGELIFSLFTRHFANGSLTQMEGRLYDRRGNPRLEPAFGGVKVYGEACLTMDSPYSL